MGNRQSTTSNTMKNAAFIRATTLSALCFAILAVDATAAVWTQTGTVGTYDWNDAGNWQNGTKPTSTTEALFNNSFLATGAQTISGSGAASTIDFNLSNAADSAGNPSYSKEFTGDISVTNFVLRQGRMAVSGTLNLTGAGAGVYSRVGTANPGGNGKLLSILDILNGGTVRAEGRHGFCVGRHNNTSTPSAGRVLLREGGTLLLNTGADGTESWSGLMLGRASASGNDNAAFLASSYVQEGGYAKIGRIMAGFEKNAVGSVTILGGILELPYISDDTRFRIGHKGYGIYQQLGGTVFVSTNHSTAINELPAATAFEIGSGYRIADGLKGAYAYFGSGSFSSQTDFSIQGQSQNLDGVAAPVFATIDGTACVTTRTVRVGANRLGAGDAILNLNGGELRTFRICSNQTRTGKGVINANGGTLVFPSLSDVLQNQFLYIDEVNIYEGGLTLRCDKDIQIGSATVDVPLKTPGGYGIESINISTPSGGTSVGSANNPPQIAISGGSGADATAISLVNYDENKMTNIVVTCRGSGYAAGDTVSVSVTRQDTTTAGQTRTDLATATLTENRPGALVKTGAGALVLFAQPDFAGTYEVRQGEMRQTTTAAVASPHVQAIVVGGIDAVFQAGSGNATAVEAYWNPVNPAAALTLGTENGSGKLTIPEGADGQPFLQTFSSLTVNGEGNAIAKANGQAVNDAGVKLAFGSISCAEGSSLTIPSHKSSFKVYVTGVHPGMSYPNIHFDGRPNSRATVADDGQLVPTPAPLVIILQ